MAFDKTKTIAVNEAEFQTRLAAVEAKASAPSTGIPQQSRLKARWSTDTIAPQADNSDVATWTDSVSGLVGTAFTFQNGGPRYKPNRFGGKPTLECYQEGFSVGNFAGSAFDTAAKAGKGTLLYVMGYRNNGDSPGGSISPLGNFFPVANNSSMGVSGSQVATQDATAFTTMAVGLDPGSFIRVNSGAVWQHYENYVFGDNFSIGGLSNGYFMFNGEILEILFWDVDLTQAEHVQFEKYIRDKYAQPYPWAGNSNYHVFDGDSLTRGQGVTFDDPKESYPYKMANQLGLKYGAWTNVAMGGRAYVDKPNNAGQGIDARATSGLDTIPALVGKNTYLYVFEWFNQSGLDSTSTQTISAAKSYLQHRVAAGFKPVFGTSTDFNASSNSGRATQRAEYNSYWDTAANRTGLMDRYVRLHTDPNVGIAGACPQNGTGNTYFDGDGIHNTGAGYTVIAANFVAAGTVA